TAGSPVWWRGHSCAWFAVRDKNGRVTGVVARTFMCVVCRAGQECPADLGCGTDIHVRVLPCRTRMSGPPGLWHGHSCPCSAVPDKNVRPTWVVARTFMSVFCRA